MLPEIKNLYVNWIDGMKINKNLFIETDLANIDAIRDAVSIGLNDFSYGLLPSEKGNESLSLDLIDTRANCFKLKINLCRAVTIGGCRIEILKSSSELTITQDIKDMDGGKGAKSIVFDLVLTVNPYERKPYGQPNAEESPLRYPFTTSNYKIQLVPSDQLSNYDVGNFSLTLGRIVLKGDEYTFDSKYIPPCTSINSHASLINYYRKLGSSLNTIEENCTKIIQKIVSKGQATALANNVKMLCEKILYYISDIFFQYRMLSLQKPPIFLIDFFIRMANQVRVLNDCYPEKEKEEMLNYFTEWTELTAGNFDNMLNDLVFHDYDHRNINNSMQKVENFVLIIDNLMNKLSSLDLIGKRKERDIFVREKSNATKPEGKKGWSLLE